MGDGAGTGEKGEGVNAQTELFESDKPRWWQWHGRQMFTELRNDFRFSRSVHRVVYHLSDAFKCRSEAEARAHFKAEYPDAQEISLA